MADEPKKEEAPNLEERLAALEAELRAEREGRSQDKSRLETYEKTLAALGRERSQPQDQRAAGGFNIPEPSAAQVAAARQYFPQADEAQIRTWLREQAAAMSIVAEPLVQQIYGALGSAADALDLHHVLLEVDDYKPNRKEVEALVKERRGEGRAITRQEATEIIKSRKIPELVRAETDRQLAEAKARQESAASTTTETTTISTGRPNPAATPKKNLAEMDDKERNAALAAIKPEDRVKALEDAIGDTPIP
jgi:hypothetical protein